MDEIVIRAIAKWPNVPAVYGWLSLDRRGNWAIKGERIRNPLIAEFIARNYAHDERGRWFFQNGPQRVFVRLAYTPLVYRTRAGDGLAFLSHTGQARGAGAAGVAGRAGPAADRDRARDRRAARPGPRPRSLAHLTGADGCAAGRLQPSSELLDEAASGNAPAAGSSGHRRRTRAAVHHPGRRGRATGSGSTPIPGPRRASPSADEPPGDTLTWSACGCSPLRCCRGSSWRSWVPPSGDGTPRMGTRVYCQIVPSVISTSRVCEPAS